MPGCQAVVLTAVAASELWPCRRIVSTSPVPKADGSVVVMQRYECGHVGHAKDPAIRPASASNHVRCARCYWDQKLAEWNDAVDDPLFLPSPEVVPPRVSKKRAKKA